MTVSSVEGFQLHKIDRSQNTSKFYTVFILNDCWMRGWGRIGASAQSRVHQSSAPYAEAWKMINEKIGEGYDIVRQGTFQITTPATFVQVDRTFQAAVPKSGGAWARQGTTTVRATVGKPQPAFKPKPTEPEISDEDLEANIRQVLAKLGGPPVPEPPTGPPPDSMEAKLAAALKKAKQA